MMFSLFSLTTETCDYPFKTLQTNCFLQHVIKLFEHTILKRYSVSKLEKPNSANFQSKIILIIHKHEHL